MADANIGGRRSGFWNEGFTGRRLKGPSRCTASEGEGDVVGSFRWVGLGHVSGQRCGGGTVSSIDGVCIREVFVEANGLVGRSGHY